MSVDAATVKRIGRLARIRIEEGEVTAYQSELNAILGFVEQLAEVDVAGVEPMTSVLDAYARFDTRQSGWIKVELKPAG